MKKEYLIYKLSEEMKEATRIDTELFSKFDVKRGLRNEDRRINQVSDAVLRSTNGFHLRQELSTDL